MKEDTIEEFFARLLTDESYHDVTLRCSDGVHVRANRLALCRCKFFETMFKGNFSEASSDIVDACFPGAVMKAIVQYIHTDNADVLENIVDIASIAGTESSEEDNGSEDSSGDDDSEKSEDNDDDDEEESTVADAVPRRVGGKVLRPGKFLRPVHDDSEEEEEESAFAAAVPGRGGGKVLRLAAREEVDEKINSSTTSNGTEGNNTMDAPDQDFLTILSLLEASDFYHLPGLGSKIRQYLASYMKQFPNSSIYLLESCPHISSELEAQAFSHIQYNNYEMLDASKLGSMSSVVLEKIILGGKATTEENKLFEIISLWSTTGSAETKDRKPIAKNLVHEHIDLHWIDVDMLSTFVQASGLVSSGQLAAAYHQQAKRAKTEYGMDFHKPKLLRPLWRLARSNISFNQDNACKSDFLDGGPLTPGRAYQWSVSMSTPHIWLGVVSYEKASSLNKLPTNWGMASPTWGFQCYDGYRHGSREVAGRLWERGTCKPRSRVILTLDLTREGKKNGFLSVSVDGKPPALVCSHMLKEGYHFVPAVSVFGRGNATLIDIKEL